MAVEDGGGGGAVTLLAFSGDSAETVRGLLASLADRHPDEALYPGLVGSIYFSRSRWESARLWYDRSLACDSTQEAIWTSRAVLELEAGNPDSAFHVASRLTARFPGSARAHWVLTLAAERLAQVHLRSHYWENVPADSEPEATAYRLTALAELDTISRIDSSFPQWRFEKASLLERLNRLPEAYALLRRIIADDSTSHVAMNYLGYVLADRNQGGLEEAELLLNRALVLAPQAPAYLDSRAWLRYRQGRFTEALTDVDSAIAHLDGDYVVVEHRAWILEALGRREEARRDWLLLLQQLPDYPPAKRALLRLPQRKQP